MMSYEKSVGDPKMRKWESRSWRDEKSSGNWTFFRVSHVPSIETAQMWMCGTEKIIEAIKLSQNKQEEESGGKVSENYEQLNMEEKSFVVLIWEWERVYDYFHIFPSTMCFYLGYGSWKLKSHVTINLG